MITLEEAKAEIRTTHNHDDVLIQQLIDAATASVLNYLKVDDASGVPAAMTPSVKQAIRIFVVIMYEDPSGASWTQVNPQFGYGYLPQPVVSLLYPLRIPSYA